jgi:pyruvate, orthophosphate dikinase
MNLRLDSGFRRNDEFNEIIQFSQAILQVGLSSRLRLKRTCCSAALSNIPEIRTMTKWVYSFGDGTAEGDAAMKNLLGGKGANLAEMCSLDLPVPPGFTITTEVCTHYYANGESYPGELNDQVEAALAKISAIAGAEFGGGENPLLVSVRSGGRASMPGMMDTVLNLGLNDVTVEALAKRMGDRRFAYDSYRRFIQMYSDVVLGVSHDHFEDILETFKEDNGHLLDTDLSEDDWQAVVVLFKERVEEESDAPFPQDPKDQLWGAVSAVFSSWMNRRAITYRRLHNIPESWGTAVNVQAMVFGNMGETSATGVAFTRNPSTGENEFYGEFLVNAQGEDVVAGIRTPQNITEKARIDAMSEMPSLEKLMPDVFTDLTGIYEKLEAHYRDMQDIEFTVQDSKLWMLQTRTGKRTAKAALRIAADMVDEGLLNPAEAVARIDPESLDQLLHPTLDPDAPRELLTTGLPASPGAAVGEIVFDPDTAELLKSQGKSVILVRIETSPEDIHGMHAAAGILTSRGGMTSHAAVVARGMGRPCVSGAGALKIDYAKKTLSVMGKTLKAGDTITLDGSAGQVLIGKIAMRQPELSGDFGKLMQWADGVRRLGIRANADTPADANMAREFGAEGIGLCRTEHMFFDAERIIAVREMILSSDETGRRKALRKLLPMQRADFTAIFEIMSGLPVTIRLLDPPLHEFLPKTDEDIASVAKVMEISVEDLKARADELHEFNPMLGHRGCRLAITYPEITEMQARAILEASIDAASASGAPVTPEIMIPLVASKAEFDFLAERIRKVAAEIEEERNVKLDFTIGTMIELPRACLKADEIAESAEFFSFGTNDLTQTCFGISRDDAGTFLTEYVTKDLLPIDPFVAIDQEGVGELMKIGVERGQKTRPDIKLGICGEHAGEPGSIHFCNQIGLDYVSCSPYRVPIARLAAAQAALKN